MRLEDKTYQELCEIESQLLELKEVARLREIEWEPLTFFNPYLNKQIDLSYAYEVGYCFNTEKYEIKSIKTNKLKRLTNGRYGDYYSFKRKGETININQYRLNECMPYRDKETFLKLQLKKEVKMRLEREKEFYTKYGVRLNEAIDTFEKIDLDKYMDKVELYSDGKSVALGIVYLIESLDYKTIAEKGTALYREIVGDIVHKILYEV